jgi:hypothetical protein
MSLNMTQAPGVMQRVEERRMDFPAFFERVLETSLTEVRTNLLKVCFLYLPAAG